MSGGSFHYLCHKADYPEQLLGDEGLAKMADFLDEEFPGSRAARDTRQLLNITNDFDDEVRALAARLQPIWHDAEWWISDDYGPEPLTEAVQKYERGDSHPLAPGVELLERALALRAYGEGAPGSKDTWRAWDTDAEVYLRKLLAYDSGK